MRVAGYTRVSTDEQAREGYSLAAQDEAIRAYCVAQRWELAEVYTDAGRSGKSMKGREALQTMLSDAKSGQFERVIFWKLDRLGRNLRDLIDVSDQLEVASVGIVSIQESIDTATAAGRMMRNVIGSLAEFERETIVERIKFGIEQKANKGKIVGPPSLGYKRNETGELVADGSAPRVLEPFERYASGAYSLRQLAQWAATVRLRSSKGNLLDRMSTRKILTNPIYVDDVAFHRRRGDRKVSPGTHPPDRDSQAFR